MECHYINLDSATERRAALEANFARYRRQGWELKRFKALDEATVEKNQVPGERSWREKGCFLSHMSLIERLGDDGRSFMVMEDDAQLGLASLEIIEGVLAENNNAQWDLLFTDISPRQIDTMMMLAFNREYLMGKRMVIPLDLAKISFVGATAYVVNGASRRKLLTYLAAGVPVDTEYDIYLNQGIANGELRAAVLFPFVTTLSEHSTKTQIQLSSTRTANMARDAFRRMMWLESSDESYNADLARIESRLQGTLYGKVAMLAGSLYFED
jgi:GR25 family glycosyltransferase involved in LPS biosynthesis